jgi:tRNA(Arg) A34 adenosine deaminase TadA
MSIRLATELAKRNPVQDLPRMGAVILDRRGRMVGEGMNSRKTDPLASKYSRHPEALCLHAEIAAIKTALRFIEVDDLPDCTLYVARVLKNDEPALAKPCLGCEKAIVEFGIGNVEWTT